MNWNQVPEFENSATSHDENPFAGSKSHSTGKLSVKLPSDEWLCQKLENSNVSCLRVTLLAEVMPMDC